MERRLEEAMRLGFRTAVIPERQAPAAGGAAGGAARTKAKPAIATLPAATLREALERCLAGRKSDRPASAAPSRG